MTIDKTIHLKTKIYEANFTDQLLVKKHNHFH